MIRFLEKYSLLCLLAVLAACSDDTVDNEGGQPEGYSRIELFLSSEPESSTRAPWNDVNAVAEELIKKALVIMVNGENKVERIFPVAKDGTGWSERYGVGTITIENGTYTFYSFGNIDYKTGDTDGKCTEAEINGLKFIVGNSIPDGLDDYTWTANYNAVQIASLPNGIPMTNKEEYLVNSSRSITLHLFRMLSKISFEFTNNTADAITVKKIELKQVTPNGTDIYLFPPKEGENIVNRFPNPVFDNTGMVAYEGTELNIPSKKSATKMAYLNESTSQHPTGQMPLTITLERKDKAGSTTTVEDVRYALMSLSGIPRNAYVVVPVSLTDYVLELKAFFYAPIGGYPPYKIDTKDNEYYCTFSTGGDFALRPFLYKFEDRNEKEKWFELTDATKVDGFSLTVSDPNTIFSVQPSFSAGEIRGTLNGSEGTASVRLSVRLKTENSKVIQEYNRTIYIIVKK
ncbi:MAG: hypothetical protein J6K41_06035 [Paraprevotella sp.]|nr:hypothetical protein [Paraprevotella sp.]